MQGAHDIQSYCLGHTSFVTCATFLSRPQGTALISGGGDGTIRYHRGDLIHDKSANCVNSCKHSMTELGLRRSAQSSTAGCLLPFLLVRHLWKSN